MKQYKCGYNHCVHENGTVTDEEAVLIGKRRWHRDCYELKGLIEEIEENYVEHISRSVPVAYLRKIVNDIIFGKKLENSQVEKWKSNLEAGRYLSFCLKFAIENGIPLTHPPGLYYLIDNARVKKAYQKEQELKVQKEIKESMKEDVEVASVPTTKTSNSANTFKASTMGFGNILKGGK